MPIRRTGCGRLMSSEFAVRDGKVYLNPATACHDGMAMAYATSRTPGRQPTQSMLEQTIGTLQDAQTGELVLHSDRCGRYRAAEWIETVKADITTIAEHKNQPENSPPSSP